jgi:hypothetical protein
MKKFLLKSLLLLLPVSLFFSYMEFSLSKLQNSYSFKRACLEKQLDSIEIVVLGSSQVLYGINPDYFCLKGFNLGTIGQPLYYDTRLMLRYIDKMPKIKYVLINISYFSLGFQLIDGPEKWRDYFYSRFWNIDFTELDIYNLKKYSYFFLYSPRLAYSYFLKGFHVNLIGGFKQNGYVIVDTIRNSRSVSDSSGYARVKAHEGIYHERRCAENQHDLELLVAELIRRNIVPVIVTPPVYSSYYKYVNKARLKRDQDTINRICNKYKCRFFNYFMDSRFTERDFYDSDHMNSLGAEKFSRIINSEILQCK